ncbi:MAG: SPASM domain-containing protein, partial [Candidatus Omnitrophota bacterium]
GVDRASLKKFSMLRDYKLVNEFIPKNDDYVLDCYKNTGDFRKNFCHVPWQSLVVNSDGWVVPCCSDYFSVEKMDNVSVEDVDKIWHNNKYIKFRR